MKTKYIKKLLNECAFKENCASPEMYSASHFYHPSSSSLNYYNYQAYIPCSVPFPSTQHNFHVHSHLWPQLKFMKSHQCWGLLGWRPSQERNELIVTLRLLLLISELSTAVDRRCPGPRPSITGPHHQETKQQQSAKCTAQSQTRCNKNRDKNTSMSQLQSENWGLAWFFPQTVRKVRCLVVCEVLCTRSGGASQQRCQAVSLTLTPAGQPCWNKWMDSLLRSTICATVTTTFKLKQRLQNIVLFFL